MLWERLSDLSLQYRMIIQNHDHSMQPKTLGKKVLLSCVKKLLIQMYCFPVFLMFNGLN